MPSVAVLRRNPQLGINSTPSGLRLRWTTTLSIREREVVAALVSGETNDEIAGRLGISRKGVEAHLSRLYERAGVASRTELAVRAEREAWLDDA